MTEKVWRAYWEGRHAGREPRPHHCTTIRPSCTPGPMQGIYGSTRIIFMTVREEKTPPRASHNSTKLQSLTNACMQDVSSLFQWVLLILLEDIANPADHLLIQHSQREAGGLGQYLHS